MGQQNSKSSNKKGVPSVKEEPGNKDIKYSKLNAPSEKSSVEDHPNEEVSAEAPKVLTHSQLKEIKPVVVLKLGRSKLEEACQTNKPVAPRDAHTREQPVAPPRGCAAAKLVDPVMKEEVTDPKDAGISEVVPANDLNHLEEISPNDGTPEIVPANDLNHLVEVSPKKVTFEVEHDFDHQEEVCPKDVTPKIVPVPDLDHSKVKKVSPKKVTFEVVHDIDLHPRLEEVAEVKYATVEFGETGSFNPGVSKSTQHSPSCSESTFTTDKLAETHDLGEDNQKGLIFKNPTTDSPTYTPQTNGSIPHLEHNKSRDLHTPPTAVVTLETVQIELCETESETKQCSDTDDMLTTAARNIVEDAIQQAIASEVVSLVICRTLGFLLVERATTNAQRLYMYPESV
ncbi:uncharacterized protein LOC134818979 [Bolinopsis microptera]|uniref:uncharacterized protein LOC134818979 n=1 Tax=Bolinopsis microptera TaxID=2820187 RepID=UPI003079D810